MLTVKDTNISLFVRFVDLYGEKIPELGEEEMKIFNQWMERWLDQKLSDFNVARELQAKCGIWR